MNQMIDEWNPPKEYVPFFLQTRIISFLKESGKKRRAFLTANCNYNKPYKSLSITPINDIKDVSSLLMKHRYGVENVYEDVSSASNYEAILRHYMETMNKWPEEQIGE